MIDQRRASLRRHLEDLRKIDGWRPFQNFVIGLLHHAGHTGGIVVGSFAIAFLIALGAAIAALGNRQ